MHPQVRNVLRRVAKHVPARIYRKASYDADGFITFGKNTDFLTCNKFMSAYKSGMNSGHKIGRAKGSAKDTHLEWRTFVACWAATHAAKLEGDFVECGVNTGILSLAVCNYVDFNGLDKDFFLFDTFEGIPEEQMTETERGDRVLENSMFYEDCYSLTKKNFEPFPRVQLIKGKIPDTLKEGITDKVSYLSIDLNIAYPEIKAMEFFWDKLVPGAVVVLDDYGWTHYKEQKAAMDEFAKSKGVMVLTMPTGQGLLIKPD